MLSPFKPSQASKEVARERGRTGYRQMDTYVEPESWHLRPRRGRLQFSITSRHTEAPGYGS